MNLKQIKDSKSVNESAAEVRKFVETQTDAKFNLVGYNEGFQINGIPREEIDSIVENAVHAGYDCSASRHSIRFKMV